jgi:hypothetical protein
MAGEKRRQGRMERLGRVGQLRDWQQPSCLEIELVYFFRN